jgi:hypothetical protein
MNGLRAGTATAAITPPLPVFLAGYGDRRGAATAVHDELEVRALVVDDGTSLVCLCIFDLLGMTPDVSVPVRAAVASALSVPLSAVLSSCVHTHAGPSALAGSDAIGWPVPDGLRELLVERAADAASAAFDRSTPVTASFARAPLPGDVAVNRRDHPLDPSAAVLDLRAPDGARVALVANFGIHPTVTGPTNLAVATDWVGPFRRGLEASGGGTVFFLQGCQGDVNPAVTSWDDGDPAVWGPVVDEYADRLAGALTAIAAGAEPSGNTLHVDAERSIEVPIGDTLLAQLAGGRRTRRVDLVEWRIGDVALVSVPGEGFHGVEQMVRAARGDAVLFAGLSPEWHGYLPVPYGEGYEEGLSLGPAAVDQIVQELVG